MLADTAVPISVSGAGELLLPPSGPLVTPAEPLVIPSNSSCPPTSLSVPCLGPKGKVKGASGPFRANSSPLALVDSTTPPDSQPTDFASLVLPLLPLGSPMLCEPSLLGSSLSSLDAQPILRAGPMGVNCSAPAKLFPSRRSSRLAAKCRGAKKSTLQRAQEIMCKKIKMMRFAAKNVCPPSSRSATSSPADSSAVDPPAPEFDIVIYRNLHRLC